MGVPVGATVGVPVGAAVGVPEGAAVEGLSVGAAVGVPVGAAVEGLLVGLTVRGGGVVGAAVATQQIGAATEVILGHSPSVMLKAFASASSSVQVLSGSVVAELTTPSGF